jgi:hypothetical protein
VAIKKTLLDTVEPIPVDALEQFKVSRRQLRAAIVDTAVADEEWRREMLDLLKAIGVDKRGQLPPRARLAYVQALQEAGFEKKRIVEIIERLYDVSERQIERDLKALRQK